MSVSKKLRFQHSTVLVCLPHSLCRPHCPSMPQATRSELVVTLNIQIAGLPYPSPSDCVLLAFPETIHDHLLYAATQYEETSFLEHQIWEVQLPPDTEWETQISSLYYGVSEHFWVKSVLGLPVSQSYKGHFWARQHPIYLTVSPQDTCGY